MTTKISVYSLSDLKSTLDDHIPLYLTSPNLGPLSVPLPKALRFKETHFYTNVRLALGYTSVAIILYIFYLDYYLKQPWTEHKLVTAWAVFAYTVLSAAMSAWTWAVERGIIFEGNRGPNAAIGLRIYSLAPHRKYDPTYRLKVEWSKGRSNGTMELTSSFTNFFQADGTFVAGEFERWLKTKVPEIFNNAGQSTDSLQQSTSNQEEDVRDKGVSILERTVADTVTGTETTQAKEGGKRRNRKVA